MRGGKLLILSYASFAASLYLPSRTYFTILEFLILPVTEYTIELKLSAMRSIPFIILCLTFLIPVDTRFTTRLTANLPWSVRLKP